MATATTGVAQIGEGAHAKQSVSHNLRWSVFLVCLGLNATAITLAVAASIISGQRVDAAFGERCTMTYFSAGQLAVVACLAMELFFIRRARIGDAIPTAKAAFIWLCVAIGMIALAIDEVFELHERFDVLLHGWLSLTPSPWTDRIDDVVVLGYGLVGLAALWRSRAELRQFRAVWPYLTIAFALFFVMVGADLLTNSYAVKPENLPSPEFIDAISAWGCVAEESCKLGSEATFISAFVAMVYAARREARYPCHIGAHTLSKGD